MTLKDTMIEEINQTTPQTPVSWDTRIYVDSASKTLHTVDDAGKVIEYADKSLVATIASPTISSPIFTTIINAPRATTVAQPAYVKGWIYFDTTLNKLRVWWATAWETITSV